MCADSAERRIIREPDLETAMLGLAKPDQLRAIEERTACERTASTQLGRRALHVAHDAHVCCALDFACWSSRRTKTRYR